MKRLINKHTAKQTCRNASTWIHLYNVSTMFVIKFELNSYGQKVEWYFHCYNSYSCIHLDNLIMKWKWTVENMRSVCLLLVRSQFIIIIIFQWFLYKSQTRAAGLTPFRTSGNHAMKIAAWVCFLYWRLSQQVTIVPEFLLPVYVFAHLVEFTYMDILLLFANRSALCTIIQSTKIAFSYDPFILLNSSCFPPPSLT